MDKSKTLDLYVKNYLIGTMISFVVLIMVLYANSVATIKTLNEVIESQKTLMTTKNDIIADQQSDITKKQNRIYELEESITSIKENLDSFKKETNQKFETMSTDKSVSASYAFVRNSPLAMASRFSAYTNLKVTKPISVKQMDYLIDYWSPKVMGGKGTPFEGKGYVFVEAAKKTGLDPIYIFWHAAVESSWGWKHHGDKYNYFGICVFDSDPSKGLIMGNSLDEGIINGAQWIKENYYDKGRITLMDMQNAGYNTSLSTIAPAIQKCYSIIADSSVE